MADTGSFGAVLRDLLGEMPVRALADAISVDKSLIYRWLHDERVPQLDTEHTAHIAIALRLDAAARKRLRQAQIASLSTPRLSNPDSPRRERDSHTAVDHLLERSASPSPPPISAPAVWRAPAINRGATVLRGRAEVVSAAIELLTAIPQAQEHREIQISVQGGRLFAGVAGEAEMQAAWQQALSGAITRGWHVVQLWRLDRDVGRTLSLVETMLQLVGSGRYHPQYFERYGQLRPPYDVMIVPPSTALLMLATEEDGAADEALVLRDEQQVALVTRHFARLRAHTRSLFQEFNPQMQELELTRTLADAESRPGGRLFIKNGLSALTYPPSWWQTDSPLLDYVVQSGLVRRADLPIYRAEYERRWQAFTKGVRDFQYRDVCPVSIVEQVGAGRGYVRPDEPFSGSEISSELRLEHLRRLAEMLRSYPNYHLALLDRTEEQLLSIEPAREVAGEQDAFIGAWSRDADGEVVLVNLHITEGTIVWALCEHFESQWERIAEQHRDRDYVIHCVEQQIALLEQRADLRR